MGYFDSLDTPGFKADSVWWWVDWYGSGSEVGWWVVSQVIVGANLGDGLDSIPPAVFHPLVPALFWVLIYPLGVN